MKLPWTIVAVLATSSYYAAIQTQANNPAAPEVAIYNWRSHTEEQLQNRIAKITLPFETRYNSEIRDLIKDYVTAGYKDTEVMLGRSVLYFPIFDHYLAAYQLPSELKYLAIIESGLKPTAESSVGAAGLWQFMPYTARQYGLTVNEQIDERKDAYKSTEAAAKMMSELYGQFNDWALVLAAYNCGAGRVKKAIEAAGGKTSFWDIQPYLPAQTQKYVPTYIAAAYVANYYQDHNLQPRYLSLDMENIRGVRIYQHMTFGELASKCGISTRELSILNPGYSQQFVPSSATGNFLLLPAEAASLFTQEIDAKVNLKQTNTLAAPLNTFRNEYVVKAGERIEELATRFKCSVRDIMRWNDLTIPEVFVHQQIVVFLHKPLDKRA
jgi:membrane-bound lytic murein transglycosylase D